MVSRLRTLAVFAVPVVFGLFLTELSVDRVVTECRHTASGVVCTNTKEGRFSRELRGSVTLEPPVTVELSVETGSNRAVTWTNHTVYLAGARNKVVFSSFPDAEASKAAADVQRLRTFVDDDAAPPVASRVEHDWPAALVAAMWVSIVVAIASAALLLRRGRSRQSTRR
jgi:hypothetical protein